MRFDKVEIILLQFFEIKNQVNKAFNSDHENQNQSDNSGIYLRDDHCDWGSSGMNEFTNEYNSN